MSDSFSPDGPQRIIDDLCHSAAERREEEERSRADLAAEIKTAEKSFQDSKRSAAERFQAEKAKLEKEYAEVQTRTEEKYKAERESLEKEYEAIRAEVEARFTAETQAAQQKLQDSHWEAIETADASRGGLNLSLKELIEGLETRWRELDDIHRQAAELLQHRGHWEGRPAAQPTAVVLEKQPGHRFCLALEKSQKQLRELAEQRLPHWFHGPRPMFVFFLIWILTAAPTVIILGPLDWRWVLISWVAAAIIATIVGTWTYRVAKRRSVDAYLALRQTLLEAGVGNPAVLEATLADCRKLDAAIISRHKEQTQQADKQFAAATAKSNRRHEEDTRRAESVFPKKLADLDAWHAKTLAEIEEKYPAQLSGVENEFESGSQRLETEHDRALRESQERFERRWKIMAGRWREGVERFRLAAEESDAESRATFPDWNSDDWEHWTPSNGIPPAIPLARTTLKLAGLKGGLPDDQRLLPEQTEFTLPLALPFPRRSLLLLKAEGAGRAGAVELMQSAMLRMLSAMPPSKVRFTIIDPVGLGENFSAFMHLADFDEQLVASRIWTDSSHIEQRLADLTKHMENVIQVYLRKEFHSIEEYNAFAGEMAEPYRVLVVANFPANFSEASAQRLKSIVSSGARCGVFVILSVDTQSSLPRNFKLNDLEAEALALEWHEGRFIWTHPEFGPMAVEFSQPPGVERFKQIVRSVGAAARDSGRVEVPFSCIIPEENDWWSADGRAGIDVALGRAAR